MRIAIIGAMQKEVEFLLANMNEYKKKELFNHSFYEGKLFNHDLIITVSGIGKVSSGMLVSTLVNNFNLIELIINIGVSGGLKEGLQIGDIVVANNLSYIDADASILEPYVFGQIPDYPAEYNSRFDLVNNVTMDYNIGMILSGDSFFHNLSSIKLIVDKHFKNKNVLCLDMESTAIGQASWYYGIDYLAIRAISDLIGSSAQGMDYRSNLIHACNQSNLFLFELLKIL